MFFFFALLAVVSSLPDSLRIHPISDSPDNFGLWMKEFNVAYDSANQKGYRYSIWSETIKEINAHNSEEQTWSEGVNAFTAHTWEEFSDTHLMAPQDCSATGKNKRQLLLNEEISARAPPAEIDWRTQKVVSEVKDQGSCGSCWTFSTTGCLESHVALSTGQLTLFSEQNLVDCAGRFKNHGCNGGLPSQAFEYIRYNGGIDSEFCYHYTAKDGTCVFKHGAGKDAGKVYEVYNVTEYNETDLYQQVGTVGPVAICFDVVSDFRNYAGGVYTSTHCGNTSKSVNHAVLAVGYGVYTDTAKTPYWTVKNSWNWAWGVKGYFLIERGKNMCGLASCASYPIVDATMLQ
jgi:cathepsin H